ncbi:iron ABC transporter permease [bacterium]|nr:iron ABC transporter permease [bacterium]
MTEFMFMRYRGLLFIALSLLLLLLSAAIAASFGSVHIPFGSVCRGFFSLDVLTEAERVIIFDLRLPRIALAFGVGAALSLSGCGLQSILRNPLADPYIVGTSSGACLGAALAIVWHVPPLFGVCSAVPVLAFAGAVLAMGAVYFLAKVNNVLPVENFLLSGVIVGSFIGALVSFLMTAAGSDLHRVILWMVGTLGQSEPASVWMVFSYLLAGGLVLWLNSGALNVMGMGEEKAQTLGVNVERLKLAVIAACSLMTAAAVSAAGMIGFLGLVVPHVSRSLIGPEHRILLPAALLNGGAFLILADTLARTAVSPQELPVGAVTALCGAPFFFWVMHRKMKN